MGTQFEARVHERLEGVSPPRIAQKDDWPPLPASSPNSVTAKSLERLTPAEPSSKSSFATGSGRPVAVSEAARLRAHRLFHERAPPKETAQVEMLYEERLALCAALRVADGDIALSDTLHAEMEDDVEGRGGDISNPSHWLARFKSLHAALDASASGLKDEPSIRLAYADRELVRRCKVTAEQVCARDMCTNHASPMTVCLSFRCVSVAEGVEVDVCSHRRPRGLRAVARGRIRWGAAVRVRGEEGEGGGRAGEGGNG